MNDRLLNIKPYILQSWRCKNIAYAVYHIATAQARPQGNYPHATQALPPRVHNSRPTAEPLRHSLPAQISGSTADLLKKGHHYQKFSIEQLQSVFRSRAISYTEPSERIRVLKGSREEFFWCFTQGLGEFTSRFHGQLALAGFILADHHLRNTGTLSQVILG